MRSANILNWRVAVTIQANRWDFKSREFYLYFIIHIIWCINYSCCFLHIYNTHWTLNISSIVDICSLHKEYVLCMYVCAVCVRAVGFVRLAFHTLTFKQETYGRTRFGEKLIQFTYSIRILYQTMHVRLERERQNIIAPSPFNRFIGPFNHSDYALIDTYSSDK